MWKRTVLSVMLKYILTAVILVAGYEVVRAAVKYAIVRRLTRSVRSYIRQYGIKLDEYKFINKFIIKQHLMNDAGIHKAVIEHAHETGMPPESLNNTVMQA